MPTLKIRLVRVWVLLFFISFNGAIFTFAKLGGTGGVFQDALAEGNLLLWLAIYFLSFLLIFVPALLFRQFLFGKKINRLTKEEIEKRNYPWWPVHNSAKALFVFVLAASLIKPIQDFMASEMYYRSFIGMISDAFGNATANWVVIGLIRMLLFRLKILKCPLKNEIQQESEVR